MYLPRRDHRFEYLWDAMSHVEHNQCGDCKLRKPESDGAYGPMCYEIEATFMQEEPVVEIEDLGDSGLWCTKFQLDS